MLREAQIPMVLWISAAMVAHMLTGGSAAHVAEVVTERAELLAFAQSVRQGFKVVESGARTREFNRRR